MAGADGTFGGRFDDPEAQYRVLYASSQRLGCFLETLARFRPDLTLIAELAAIGGEDDFVPPGTVPPEWMEERRMGVARVEAVCADIGASDWLGHLRSELARKTVALGFGDFDAANLQQSVPRSLTQAISRSVYQEDLSGIRYLSRYGHDIENWAIFEPFRIEGPKTEHLTPGDFDFQTALRIHGLRLGSTERI